jgi:hypothetical protein
MSNYEKRVDKQKKPHRGIDWNAIFRRRPDLIPPGYEKTIKEMYSEGQSEGNQ